VPVDDLDAVVTALAGQLGERVGDLDDEHERCRIFERAVQRRLGLDLVFRAIGLERDQSMAESVVTSVLEELPDSEHAAWIDQLAPDHRRYSQNRSAEIAIVRRARSAGYHAEELAAHLDTWSDWVQRRLVLVVDDPQTLAVLARHGRTRKVRNAAAERLRHVPGESGRRPGPG
jgi:hypothetical protein